MFVPGRCARGRPQAAGRCRLRRPGDLGWTAACRPL